MTKNARSEDESLVNVDEVPEALTSRDQWLVARRSPNTDRDKEPIKPRDPTAAERGFEFESALKLASKASHDGTLGHKLNANESTTLGFILSPDSRLVFIDWDDVRNPHIGEESIPEIVREWVTTIGGFVSISVSGTGLHQPCLIDKDQEASLNQWKSRSDLPIESVEGLQEQPHVEVYSENCYFTVTGQVWTCPETGFRFDSVEEASDELIEFGDEFLESSREDQSSERSVSMRSSDQNLSFVEKANRAQQQTYSPPEGEWIETDSPSVEQVRETGFLLNDEFRQLWLGQDVGFPSTSEADHKFVSHLWYYCDDEDLVRDCLRRCDRWRSKWNRSEYLEYSIEGTRDNKRHEGRYYTPTSSNSDPTVVHFDGGARPSNPGPAAIGYIVENDNWSVEKSKEIGRSTNNRAEYQALIRGLETALEKGVTNVEARGDSQLVAKQVQEEWNTNDKRLRQLRDRVHELAETFDQFSICEVAREENEEADRLVDNTFKGSSSQY